MNKIILLFIFTILVVGCSFNKNSKFWTASQNIPEVNLKEVFPEEKTLIKEFNPNLKIKIDGNINNNSLLRSFFNNDGRLNYDGTLKKTSRYKFSKIENFYKFEPTISFFKKNII